MNKRIPKYLFHKSPISNRVSMIAILLSTIQHMTTIFIELIQKNLINGDLRKIQIEAW